MRICSPISPETLGVNTVFAMVRPDTGVPLVVFGYSAQRALAEAGRAIAIARLPGVHESYLEGFLRYRATPLKFHEELMSAKQFAVRLGPPKVAAAIENMSETGTKIGEGSGVVLIMYVLAHELAHHVNRDVLKPDRTDEDQRNAEALADNWATSKLLALGVDPILATVSMVLLNELETQSESDTRHPPPLARALTIATESLRVAEKNPASIESYLAPVPTSTTLAANASAYIESLSKLRSFYQSRVNEEDRLQTDNSYLKQTAYVSTKARIAIGKAYATGERAGIPQDWQLARFWMHNAQEGSDPYEYDYRADAQVLLAKYHAAPGGNMSAGCSMLGKAAAVKHSYAQALLKAAIRTGQCAAD